MPSLDLNPDYLERQQRILGSDFKAYQAALNEPAVTGLRVNTLKLSPPDFLKISPFPLTRLPWSEAGFRVEDRSAVPGKHPYHAAGLYYLQDPSAMAVAELLAPKPGERVLDLAAAPGGKTTHLAACMHNQGLLAANEIHPQRAWALAENLERCGVQHALVLNETPARLADHFGAFFDRVLVDAPCSGEGMFRKSVDARQVWSPELVAGCAVRQTAILEQAARLVRPGGWLAYTTCTFSIEENEGVISGLLERRGDLEPANLSDHPLFKQDRPSWASSPILSTDQDPSLGSALLRLWPHHDAPEGHFIALLRRKSEPTADRLPPRTGKKTLSSPASGEARQAFEMFVKAGLDMGGKYWSEARLVLEGSYLYYQPEGLPDLDGLRLVHPGWWLGVMKKKRFEPSHALALAMTVEGEISLSAQRCFDLKAHDPRVLAYLGGESLFQPGENGWLVVSVDGFPLGWGKRTQGQVKNAYPRGLRWV